MKNESVALVLSAWTLVDNILFSVIFASTRFLLALSIYIFLIFLCLYVQFEPKRWGKISERSTSLFLPSSVRASGLGWRRTFHNGPKRKMMPIEKECEKICLNSLHIYVRLVCVRVWATENIIMLANVHAMTASCNDTFPFFFSLHFFSTSSLLLLLWGSLS